MSYSNRVTTSSLQSADANPFNAESSPTYRTDRTPDLLFDVRSAYRSNRSNLPGLTRLMSHRSRWQEEPMEFPLSTSRNTLSPSPPSRTIKLHHDLLQLVRAKLTAHEGELRDVNVTTEKGPHTHYANPISTISGVFSTFPQNGIVKTYHFLYDARHHKFRCCRVEHGEAH